MASATQIITSRVSIEHPERATEWAHKIRSQSALISPYEDVEDVPSSITIDESVMNAPRQKAADAATAELAEQIAEILYPTHNGIRGPIALYEKDLTKLRKAVTVQRKRTIEENTKHNEEFSWAFRILKQGPWDPIIDPMSLNGAPSLPMPVDIAEPETLAPFFEHLALGGNDLITSTIQGQKGVISIEEPFHHTSAIEFERGVAYSDGRMDLCKMVVGPNNIEALMESLKTNEFITHFLLGNNIIGPHGAKCIASFLKEFPNRMDTWYLAGNCIDAPSFKLLVNEWVRSTIVTNIWLKRNPLSSSAAADVFRLITETQNLRTLDLDQTELGDDGVAELFAKLSQHTNPLSLRHIYLSAIGIGVQGAGAIANFLASPHCLLESLYMTNNPLGNEGVTALANGLKANKTLTRLTLASVGVSDEGTIALCKALHNHPALATLDIGQSYATEDLQSRYNYITDTSAPSLRTLIASLPHLTYLDVHFCAMTASGLSIILTAVLPSSLQFHCASTIHPQPRPSPASKAHAKLAQQAHATLLRNVKRAYGEDTTYDAFMSAHKRWLVSDRTDVRKIDSVYRNRDAGAARRGLGTLEKSWGEGDEVLREVMRAEGPVCVRRRRGV